MALTAYCKKCGRDMTPGEICPRCGGRLGRNTFRVAWCVDHTPVRDWMSWNAAMRIVIPVLTIVFVLVVLLEGISAGWDGVEALLRGGLLYTLLGLTLAVAAVLLLVLILQGDDVLDCAADSRGVHVQQYLPDPTPLKLLLRLRSPRLLEQMAPEEEMLCIGQREVTWKEITRVQLWPEKTMVLFYAPSWWMRVCLPCTPFSYMDVLDYVRDRIGAKKNVLLPTELHAEKPVARPARSAAPRPSRPAPAQEELSDLTDVLQQIKAMNDADSAPPEQ